jgi:hypothetical protein
VAFGINGAHLAHLKVKGGPKKIQAMPFNDYFCVSVYVFRFIF